MNSAKVWCIQNKLLFIKKNRITNMYSMCFYMSHLAEHIALTNPRISSGHQHWTDDGHRWEWLC